MSGSKARSADDLSLLLGYGVDAKARRVFLHAGLEHPDGSDKVAGEGAIEHVVRSLLFLSSTGPKPIELWLNTPGGCIWEMWGLIDIMNSIEVPIITIGFGSVCSAGGPILVTGDHRFATTNCKLMVHEGTVGGTSLPRSASKARTAVEDELSDLVYTVMGEKTTKSRDFWKKVDQKCPETWYNVDQMKEFGVIDEVYSPEAVRALGY